MEKTILVAEDDPNDVFLLERAFAKTGLTVNVRFVRDGEEALQYLKGEKHFSDRTTYPLPDLLLLDIKMPKLSGLEVLEWVRHEPAFQRTLVVMLTSSTESNDIKRAYDLGANSYLVKPLGHENLLELARMVQDYWLRLNQPPQQPVSARSI